MLSRHNFAVVESLLDVEGVNPNCVFNDSKSSTPLLVGIQNLDIVKVLLSHGADPNKPNVDGDTPLHWACSYGKLEIAKVLSGADANKTNKRNETPFILACKHGDMPTIKWLIQEAGAKPNASFHAFKAFFPALDRGLSAKALLELGFDPRRPGEDGQRVCHMVVQES